MPEELPAQGVPGDPLRPQLAVPLVQGGRLRRRGQLARLSAQGVPGDAHELRHGHLEPLQGEHERAPLRHDRGRSVRDRGADPRLDEAQDPLQHRPCLQEGRRSPRDGARGARPLVRPLLADGSPQRPARQRQALLRERHREPHAVFRSRGEREAPDGLP